MMFMEQNNQCALVTGGTSGIGYELAKLLAADGYNLILVARTQEDLDRVAGELREAHGVDVRTISKDLFYPGNAFELTDEIGELGIQVNILVNDAGQGQYGPFVDNDINRQLDIIHLNIESLVILTHYFLKEMVGRAEGRILNLASIAGKTPGPYQAVYHGTKAFVHSFTEAIRSEVKDTGVTVTSLLPGATDTDFFNKAEMLDAKNVKEGELADPAKVAKDGYEALMSGQDMVVSGFKNKMTVAMSNVTPDEKVADKVKKQQSPASKENH
jgi:short-subunit dehydrogenase